MLFSFLILSRNFLNSSSEVRNPSSRPRCSSRSSSTANTMICGVTWVSSFDSSASVIVAGLIFWDRRAAL